MTCTPVLMYHSVCARPGSGDMVRYVLDPGLLAEHLDALANRPTYTMAELATGADPDARGVCLTFDDAYADFHTTVLPMLVDRGLRASLYVPTAYLGGRARFLEPGADADRPVLSLTQLREIAASGLVEIGAHSHTHPQLDRVDRLRAQTEARLPRTILEDELGVPVTTFAYPYGYHDPASRAAVADAGYAAAVSVTNRRAHHDDRFAVPRHTVAAGTSAQEMLALVDRPWTRRTALWAETRRLVGRGLRVARRGPAAPHPLDVDPRAAA